MTSNRSQLSSNWSTQKLTQDFDKRETTLIVNLISFTDADISRKRFHQGKVVSCFCENRLIKNLKWILSFVFCLLEEKDHCLGPAK